MENKTLKNKLKNNTLTIGSWITIPSTDVIEIMAQSGFEWLVIDLEHTSISISECKSMIQSIQSFGIEALVRIPENNKTIIKRVLDAGADGIIIPMVKNKKDAEYGVKSTRYPEKGIRGVGLSRAQKYGFGFDEYKKWSESEIIVIVQIEHIDALININEILNVEGVDGTLIGPYDLSASMGFPGQYDRDDVKKVMAEIKNSVVKKNKSLGFHVIEPKYEELKNKIDKGFNFIPFSIDFLFLGQKIRDEIKKLKR